MIKMCDLVDIDHSRIPININKDVSDTEVVSRKSYIPKGLKSERSKLESMSLPYKLVGCNNLYELLYSM
jgi:hypothetical protein